MKTAKAATDSDLSEDINKFLNEEDFDFHDTIPAPPWLDETDANEESSLPR